MTSLGNCGFRQASECVYGENIAWAKDALASALPPLPNRRLT